MPARSYTILDQFQFYRLHLCTALSCRVFRIKKLQLKTQNVDDENGFFSSARIHLFSTTTNEFDNLGNENIAIGETNDERVQEKMAGVLYFLFVHCLDRKAVFTVHVMA